MQSKTWHRCPSIEISEQTLGTKQVALWGLHSLKCVCSYWKRRKQVLLSWVETTAIAQCNLGLDDKRSIRNAVFMCWWNREQGVSTNYSCCISWAWLWLCVCEKNNTSRGGFERHKALGVVADLKTVRTVVKMCAWYARSPWEPKGPLT